MIVTAPGEPGALKTRLFATPHPSVVPVGVTVPEQGADVVLSFVAGALHVMQADA